MAGAAVLEVGWEDEINGASDGSRHDRSDVAHAGRSVRDEKGLPLFKGNIQVDTIFCLLSNLHDFGQEIGFTDEGGAADQGHGDSGLVFVGWMSHTNSS